MTRKKSFWTCTTALHNMLGKPGRFEPPWAWKQRFTLDELKEIYLKLFKYDWFHDMKKPASEDFRYRHYSVGGQGWYGYVKLKDGGRARLEFLELRELDWLLYNGYEFAFDINNTYKAGRLNPLWHRETREEVMITLDLLQKG